MLFFNIVSLYFNTLFNCNINLTIDDTIYPSQHFPFGAAFVCQAGNFWTLLRITFMLCFYSACWSRDITWYETQQLYYYACPVRFSACRSITAAELKSWSVVYIISPPNPSLLQASSQAGEALHDTKHIPFNRLTDIFDIDYCLKLRKPQCFEKMNVSLSSGGKEKERTLVGPLGKSVSVTAPRARCFWGQLRRLLLISGIILKISHRLSVLTF